jgi:hypothetical protein
MNSFHPNKIESLSYPFLNSQESTQRTLAVTVTLITSPSFSAWSLKGERNYRLQQRMHQFPLHHITGIIIIIISYKFTVDLLVLKRVWPQ